jgi:hypothetical protein
MAETAETCGTDLVILLDYFRILLIRNFESVIQGDIAFSDAALEIVFPNSYAATPGNIAFRNGKVAVYTVSPGQFSMLDPTR